MARMCRAFVGGEEARDQSPRARCLFSGYGICLPDSAVYVTVFPMTCMLSLAEEKSTLIDTADTYNWLLMK